MKAYLANIVKQLRNFSLSLDKSALIIDKPWTLIDEDQEIQKLIFRKDKSLVLSKNGQALIGSWDYFPEAKSLLIDRGTDKILCNEGYIDQAVMILKLDGTTNQYFALANENILPDLNIEYYLKRLRVSKLNLIEVELNSGKMLEVQPVYEGYNTIHTGANVFIEGNDVKDGVYISKVGLTYYFIRNQKIENINHGKYYRTSLGNLLILQKSFYNVGHGDRVFIGKTPAPDGKYRLSLFKSIKTKNGIII